ncbi:MAG: hypothetical protein IPQ07_33085 [Myxococcales bacterium]|nr:hypothetical protein [Myxococcales bacterium]
MTATSANATAPGELRVVTADVSLERETIRALADALLGVSTVVDVGGRVGAGGAHLAMYCEVPSKTRGTSWRRSPARGRRDPRPHGSDRHRGRSVHGLGRGGARRPAV